MKQGMLYIHVNGREQRVKIFAVSRLTAITKAEETHNITQVSATRTLYNASILLQCTQFGLFITKAVNRRLPALAALSSIPHRSGGICVQSSTEADFFEYFGFPLPIVVPRITTYIIRSNIDNT
jgi:hypothetical protein